MNRARSRQVFRAMSAGWLLLILIACMTGSVRAKPFRSHWPDGVERVWLGRNYWANRLQDWRLQDGRIECVTSGTDRNVALLTRQLGEKRGSFRTSVRLGRLDKKDGHGWAGFSVGRRGRLAQWPELADYRDNAVRGDGLKAGISMQGDLLIGSERREPAGIATDHVKLELQAEPQGDAYELTLRAREPDTGRTLGTVSREVKPERLVGGVALVCEATRPDGRARNRRWTGGNCRFWFDDWTVSGSKVVGDGDQGFGPILWSAYTLSRGTLKMTAQMPPVGRDESRWARLEVHRDGAWREVGRGKMDPLARTATVRVENWDDSRDVPYRLVYALTEGNGRQKDHYWRGTIRRNPAEKRVIKVAGFTGNADYAWPNADMVRKLKRANPDVLFFSGDQIYENVNDYGTQRSPLEAACLDYLRKWYFFGWSFRELLRDRPSIMIPDDHDVYQGNLFGEAGKKAEGGWIDGGYTMPVEWVNMVQRTQTSHLPDPYDATPVKRGIEVYYTDMNYGRISFAVIEDRKFKTGPRGILPDEYVDRADHVTNPDFEPEMADVPRAVLLGERQLAFLREWAADWRSTDMKVALSQTVFANAATHHGGGLNYLLADLDSNGWPQTGRNRALDALRRGFAFHLCGDQHLATLIHHGIDDWGDAGWSLAVPSICNFYMRAWRPKKTGEPLGQDMPEYTGRYRDGLGNRISVWAATNPGSMDREPGWLHDKKPGFGLLELDKRKLQIKVECWPRWADPTGPDSGQFEGWPKTVSMAQNYGREPTAYLPTVEVRGMEDPVIQVIEESTGEVVYTRRTRGSSCDPGVFSRGTYTVRAGEPGTARWKAATGLKTHDHAGAGKLTIDLR